MAGYPEIVVNLEEGNLALPPEPKIGDSVMIFGTSTDGPKFIPTRITSTDSMKNLFGTITTAPCNIALGLSHIARSHRDVTVMKITGQESETVLLDLGKFSDGTVLMGGIKLEPTATGGSTTTFEFTAPVSGFGSADNDLLGYVVPIYTDAGVFVDFVMITEYTILGGTATATFDTVLANPVQADWTMQVAGMEVDAAGIEDSIQLEGDYFADVIVVDVTTGSSPDATLLVENTYNYTGSGTLSNANVASYALNRRTGIIKFNPCFVPTGSKVVITGWRYPYSIKLTSLFAGSGYNGDVRSDTGAARSNENATYQIEPIFNDAGAQVGKKLTITNPVGRVFPPIVIPWSTGAALQDIANAINVYFPDTWVLATVREGLDGTTKDTSNITLRPTTSTATLGSISGYQAWSDLTPATTASEASYLTTNFGYYVPEAWDSVTKLLKFRFGDNEERVLVNIPAVNGIFEKCSANRTVTFTGGEPTTEYNFVVDYNETAIVYPISFTTNSSGEATVTITHAATFEPALIALTAVSDLGDVLVANYTTYDASSSWHTNRSFKYDIYNLLSPVSESTTENGLIPKGLGERGAYDLVLNTEAEHALVFGAYFDDALYPPQPESLSIRSATMNFASQGARMAYRSVARGFPKHFYSSFKPLTLTKNAAATKELWVSYVLATAQAASFDIFDSNFSLYADAGKFLNLIAGPPVVIDGTVSTPEASYAGAVASKDTWEAMTHKIMPVQGLDFRLFDDQLRALVQANITTFDFDRFGNVICKASDVFASPISPTQQSDYVRLATGREVFAIINGIRLITEVYIGGPINAAVMGAMHTAIRTFLSNRKELGAIQFSHFTIEASGRDQIDGTVRIKVVIIPSLELRRVLLTIALEAPAPLSV